MEENPFQSPESDARPQRKTKPRAEIVALWAGIAFNIVSLLLACPFLFETPSPGHRIKPGFASCPLTVVTIIAMATIWPRSLLALWQGKWVLGLTASVLAITPLPLFLGMSVLFLRFKGGPVGWD